MAIDLGKKTGAISLDKGQRVTIEKTPKTTAVVSFSSATDYDVYAVILLKDGSEHVCSTFGSDAQPQPTAQVLGVKHLGDVARGGGSSVNTETLEIVLSDEIDQIAVVAYSAQSNGTGSFRKYNVSMKVDNGAGTTVAIDARDADANDNVYTCVPAILRNTADGVVIEQVEMYSKPGSEYRPSFIKKGLLGKKSDGNLAMDAGSKNKYK
jgi:tellurite resistance protein TerA